MLNAEAKIDNFQIKGVSSTLAQKYVLGLKVPMHVAPLMDVAHTFENVLDSCNYFTFGQGLGPLK